MKVLLPTVFFGRVSTSPEKQILITRWGGRLALFLAPLVLLTLFEVGLRIGGYGNPSGFSIARKAAEGVRYSGNPHFGQTYFGPVMKRAPVPFVVSIPKPPDVCRVVLLGGSAAQGIPVPAFGMGPVLEVLLEDRYPGTDFEVINAAMTAINSHVVTTIAEDCLSFDPDLFVVYVGNNEVVGPYGAGSVFSPLQASQTLIKASILLKRTRVGQLALEGLRGMWDRGDGEPGGWQGMAMFTGHPVASSDRRLDVTRRHFHENLTAICRLARRADVPMVLCTVPVNLADNAPFGSRHGAGVSAPQLEAWEAHYRDGIALENTGAYAEALALYERAWEIDDEFAELAYHMGHCCREINDAAAVGYFEHALEHDALRFRADKGINQVIRQVVADAGAADVVLADSEAAMRSAARSGLPGREHFFEHVHLRFPGNYLIARTVLDACAPLLPDRAEQAAGDRKPLTVTEVAQRLPFTFLDHYEGLGKIIEMMKDLPFTSQAYHEETMRALETEQASVARYTAGALLQQCLQAYRSRLAVAGAPWETRYRYALLQLHYGGDAVTAERELRTVMQATSPFALVDYDLGRTLLQRGRVADAHQLIENVLERDPNDIHAHLFMSDVEARAGNLTEAIRHLEKALVVIPETTETCMGYGTLLGMSGQFAEAEEAFRQAVDHDPGSSKARVAWASALSKLGRTADAARQFTQVLARDEGNSDAHYGLAGVLWSQGDRRGALRHLERAAVLKPDSAGVHQQLGIVYREMGNPDQAGKHFRIAAELRTRHRSL